MPRLAIASLLVDGSPEAQPLGAACVKAALEGLPGLEVELLTARLTDAEPLRALVAAIDSYRPEALGLSLYSWNREPFRELLGRLRGRHPGLVLFAGGPEAGAEPEAAAKELGLDFVVAGEAEEATRRLFESALGGAAAGRGTSGAAFRGGLLRAAASMSPNAKPPVVAAAPVDPAAAPSPLLSGAIRPERGGALWELARGCPFRCAYCYESRGVPGVRPFPRRRIEAELELLAAAAPLEVFVLDPTFNADRKRALSLLGLFRERGRGLRWKFEIRAEFLDRAQAEAFAGLDCSLQAGLQSADPEVLAGVGRPGFSPEAFAAKMALLDEAGVPFGLDLIYGLPGDRLSGFRRSLDFALGLGPNHLDLFRLSVLPGTELRDRAAELGLEVEARAPHRLLSAPGFPAADMERAAELARAAELWYTKGRAVAWFGRACAALRLRPSALLETLAARQGELDELERLGADEPRFARLQAEALVAAASGEAAPAAAGRGGASSGAPAGRGGTALADALRDTVLLEGALAAAMAEGRSTRLELSYDARELASPEAFDLRAYAARARRSPGAWEIAPGRGGPRLRRVPPGGPPRGSAGGGASAAPPRRPHGSPRG